MNQTEPCAEIIVVDRFSHDGLFDYATSVGATLFQSDANRSEARNIGLLNATSKGVLFVDADMILPPSLVEECERGLTDFDALIIPEQSVGIGFWAECKAAERSLHSGNEDLEAARCFRRSDLVRIGGYNPQLEAGEDWDLQNRARANGISVGRTSSRVIHDEGHLTLPRILGREYHYGQTFGRYITTNPRRAFRQINPIRRIIAPSLSLVSTDVSHGLGVLVLRTLEFAAATVGHVAGTMQREVA